MGEKELSQKKTDAQWIADLFTDNMTDKEKYDKLSKLLSMTCSASYSDSMAGELSSGNPSAQALWWEEVCEHKYAIEKECDILKAKVELYEGETDEEGRPHGKGIKYFSDGRRYEGEWAHGVREGYGIEYAEDGTKFYEGNWSNNKCYGNGVLISWQGVRYEGFFDLLSYNAIEANLSKEHHSVRTYPNGEVIEGPVNGTNYICTYPNGDTLECKSFVTPSRGSVVPCPSGEGIHTFADGSTLCGYWDNYGKKQNKFHYTAPDGTKTIRYYDNDVLVSESPDEE